MYMVGVKEYYSSKVTGPSARGLKTRNQFGAAEVLIILLVIDLVLPLAKATEIGPEVNDCGELVVAFAKTPPGLSNGKVFVPVL